MKSRAFLRARINALCIVAGVLVACGGRVDDFSTPSDDATSGDDGGAESGPITDDVAPDSTLGDSIVVDDAASPDDAPFFDSPTPSDSGTPAPDAPFFDAPPRDTGPNDVGADITADTTDPLDTICTKLADAICTPTEDKCCTSRGVTFDAAGCRLGVLGGCAYDVQETRAGRRTFNPSQVPACIDAWKRLTAQCSIPIVDFVKTYDPCTRVFASPNGPGAACQFDSDCQPGAAPRSYGSCDPKSKTCIVTRIVPFGQCNYTAPLARICDAGQYCPFFNTQICRTATALGQPCSSADSPQCGLGFTCASTAQGNRCMPGLPAGAACTNALSCASWTCTAGACTDPNVELGNKATCTGQP